MTVEVDVGGRQRVVTVEPAGAAGRFRVRVDARVYEVGAVRSSPYALLLSIDAPGGSEEKKPAAAADNRMGRGVSTNAEVFVTPMGPQVLVNLSGRTVAATVNGRRAGRGADIARQTHGEARIVAPMPGRVVRVLVGVGDEVAVRQPLVVVEAMKMENELRAPKAGRVRDVSVAAGASVEAGRVLLVIE